MKMAKKLCAVFFILLMLAALAVPAFADSGEYVFDMSGAFSFTEQLSLESRASRISSRYDVGVYIAVVDDYRDYGNYSDIWKYARHMFDSNDLGIGPDRNGVFLVLSLNTRDYALDFHGAKAEYAFTESGRDELIDRFLDDFGRDDFAAGMRDYLSTCEEFLELAEQGTPYEKERPGIGALAAVPGAIIAAITAAFTGASMKSSGTKRDADHYVSGSLTLTRRSDMFLNRTVTRVPKAQSSGSGGSGSVHHSGGGHSGRSGKF